MLKIPETKKKVICNVYEIIIPFVFSPTLEVERHFSIVFKLPKGKLFGESLKFIPSQAINKVNEENLQHCWIEIFLSPICSLI